MTISATRLTYVEDPTHLTYEEQSYSTVASQLFSSLNSRSTMEELRVELKNNGQDHLLAFWETLSPDDRKQLYGDLRSIDYPEVMRYFKACTETADRPAEKVDDQLQPIPAAVLGSVTRTDAETLAAYQEEGGSSDFFVSFMLFPLLCGVDVR